MARKLILAATAAAALAAAALVAWAPAHAAGLGVLDLTPDKNGGQTYTVPFRSRS
jgi:hypothetical protein